MVFGYVIFHPCDFFFVFVLLSSITVPKKKKKKTSNQKAQEEYEQIQAKRAAKKQVRFTFKITEIIFS